VQQDVEIQFASTQVNLNAAPINPAWILHGEPQARNRLLSGSPDGTACTLVWDCTAGRFNWFYDIDETVFVIEGAVIVRDHKGGVRRLEAGDTAFFPAGSHAEWTVETYVRKLAFCRFPLPRQVLVAKHVVRALRRLFGRGQDARKGGAGPAMFGNPQGNAS
jgi:uncharacterized cupin superfamily protein